MIGKISIGRSFKGCVLYCMEDKAQKLKHELVMKERAEMVHYNLCYGNKHEIIKQLNDVRELNPKLSKPVLHISLSLAPGDLLGKGKLSEMAQECAKQMGFENNQYIAVYHKDTKHQHLHIIANRVGFDGKTVSDSNNYQRIAKYCRSMELKLGLREVLSPRRYLSQKERLIPRNDIRKEELKQRIRLCIQQSKSILEFEHRMKQYGYDVIRGRGIAFRDAKKVYVKGSEVGYSLSAIERQLKMQLMLKQSITAEQKHFLSLQRKMDKIEENKNGERHEQSQKREQKFEHKKEGNGVSESKRNKQRHENILEVMMDPTPQHDETPTELKHGNKQENERRLRISR